MSPKVSDSKLLKAVAVGGLMGLLVIAITPSVAVNQYTATYLLELYVSARSDLVSLLDVYLNVSVSADIGSTSEIEGGTSTSTQTSTTTSTATSNTTSTTSSSTSTSSSWPGPMHHPSCADIEEFVNSTIQLADQYASAANVSLQSGNYVLASRQALEALNLVGRAYVRLSMCLSDMTLPEHGEEAGPGANVSLGVNVTRGFNATHSPHLAGHPAVGLVSAVLRHEVRLSRLKATLKAAEESGVNVSQGWDLVDEVEDLLARAKELALEGNSTAAAQLLKEANEAMSTLVSYLRTSSAVALERRCMEHGHRFNASSGWEEHANFTGNATAMGHGHGGEHGRRGVAGNGTGVGGQGPAWNANWTTPGPEQGRGHGYGHGEGGIEGGRHSNSWSWPWGGNEGQEGGGEGGS